MNEASASVAGPSAVVEAIRRPLPPVPEQIAGATAVRAAQADTSGHAGFAAAWPRRFARYDLRRWLGVEPDPALEEALAAHVNAPLWDLADRGGKRWRPMLARTAYLACGGASDPPPAFFEIPELLHEASLVIDDVEDGAETRRGGPAVHRAHGVATAINAANAAYFRAYALLRETLPDEHRLRAADALSDELFAAHLGQALDLALHAGRDDGASAEQHYLAVAGAKTGALVRIAVRLGAIAAGAPVTFERALVAWASAVGVAYQIRDDADDVAEGLLELAQGRLTYPAVILLRGDAPMAAELREVLALPDGRCRRERLLLLCAAANVEPECRLAALRHADAAARALRALPPGPPRDALAAFAWRIAES